jgi:hypothetical protein
MIPIVAGLLMGAAMGGGIAALQGKDVLKGALLGGAGGALGGILMPAAGGVMGGTEGAIAGSAGSTATTTAGTSLAPAYLSPTGMAETGTMFAGGSLPGSTTGLGLKIPTSMGGLPTSTAASTGATAGTGLTVPTHMANAVGATGGAGGGGMFSGGIGNFLTANKGALTGGALAGMFAPGEKPPSPEQGNIREFAFNQGEKNPLFGNPGESYYTAGRGFTEGAVTPVEEYTAANGGIIALAEGGEPGIEMQRYSRPIRTIDPAVAAYNAQIMERANQQYNINNRPGPNQVPGSIGYVAPPPPKVGVAKEYTDLIGDSKRKKENAQNEFIESMPYYNHSSVSENANGGLMRGYNEGGISTLGSYSDGGQLLKGPGDGVSDSIPAQIGARQPARLADGEFVVPARVVSELGNGSTDAGAKQLYAMMDRVQKNRKKSIGKGKVAVDAKSRKLLPA